MTKSIFIASSSELKPERMELIDLFLDLNNVWSDYGVRFRPVAWEFMDSSMQDGRKEDEYLTRLRECEVCIVLFWKSLGEYTVEELEVAIAEKQAGRCPKHVLVLYKEPSVDILPELLDYKQLLSKNHPNVSYGVFTNEESLREEVTHYLISSL